MNKIQVMSEDLANKIAAGEVVEKTMNVVKELVENSIDAESTYIKVELVDSGIKKIIVTDNGIGMSKEDAVLAFSRHATSKLKKFEDLFNIDSLGFRGEALPSIASISNVYLKTSNGETGTEVIMNGGVISDVKSSDLKKGTRIEVSELFYNTPVRLKYLKSSYIELSNITEYLNKMALSFPNIKFELINNGKSLLNTDGSNNLLKVINVIYGLDVTKKMIEVNSSNDDYEIKGFISYPEIAKSNKNCITTLVNGRVIKNSELNKTIIEAYHTYIPIGKYPIIVLNIDVDPYLIDINIHPTKMDIKFSKFDKLQELVTKTIENKLTSLTLIPSINNIEKKSINNDTFPNYRIEEKEKTIESNKEYINIEEVTLNFSVSDKNEEELRIKKMYPVGLVHGTYIIAENEDGMYIIDQHAANERINYEKYVKEMGSTSKNITDLLVPIKIEIANNDYLILKENFNILENLGFVFSEFGINTLLFRSHPNWLPTYNLIEAIKKIIDIIVIEEDFSSTKFNEKIAITMACKMSIKANEHISLNDMEILLDNLSKTDNPFTCPHGRPTIISYSKYELEKIFKRAMD